MKTRDYVTVKELKEILANIPDDDYICVQGGEDVGGRMGRTICLSNYSRLL